MIALAFLTPVFLCFEIWQLVICERHLGLRQIARGTDPRLGGLSERTALVWGVILVVYWLWMFALLLEPAVRIPAVGLLAISALGYSVRRGAPLRWILVVLTFEGAIRLGLLFSLATAAWRELA